jgi:hypothetical protein
MKPRQLTFFVIDDLAESPCIHQVMSLKVTASSCSTTCPGTCRGSARVHVDHVVTMTRVPVQVLAVLYPGTIDSATDLHVTMSKVAAARMARCLIVVVGVDADVGINGTRLA